ncbi:hypothetical protein [Gorillibacterium sp. sgz5001074]|uniref:hypothetical protein n=1 Tax=Gorillibacterium sp. sgz5001074 TaxID=3446695 RepID=UPI003F67E3A3
MNANHAVIEAMERSFNAAAAEAVLEMGLVRYDRPGHTRQMAHMAYCHEGRYSAGYYAFGTLLGKLDHAEGLKILEALEALQIADPDHPQYGGFLWYREEREIQDSNAAFFILMPLVTVRLCRPDAFPSEHLERIDRMLSRAVVWFSHECREPQIYYPNKILSDGAMLLAVAVFSKDEKYIREAVSFFERWEDYTERRGWGWGENISLVYQSVMMNALRIAVRALEGRFPELAGKLCARMEELKRLLRFHNGEEFVPTIRSYNFQGETVRKSTLWAIAGVSSFEEYREHVFNLNDLVGLLLFEEELERAMTPMEAPQVPRTLVEKVFDQSWSTSWIGESLRVGSINRFPILPGCYQWPTWGLGWQSFPVSFSVREHQVSHLRWFVDNGEGVRTHPMENYHVGYLKPALFLEPIYPDVRTRSSQSGALLLVVRSMDRLNNRVAELADEWVVPRFGGEVLTLTTEAGTRTWTVLRYPHAAVAITALSGIAAGGEERTAVPLEVVKEADRIRIRQVLYRGSDGHLQCRRVEAAWAVAGVDRGMSLEELQAYLDTLTIDDRTVVDREVPRTPDAMPRRCSILVHGVEEAVLVADPYDTLA